jgi:hypothetical protein
MDGRKSSAVKLEFGVLIVVSNDVTVRPPVRAPVVSFTTH